MTTCQTRLPSASGSDYTDTEGNRLPVVAMEVAKERCLRQLGRGWRTPDPSPSPSRGVAELPPCRPWSWCCTEEDEDDSANSVDDNALPFSNVNTDSPTHGHSQIRRSSSLLSQGQIGQVDQALRTLWPCSFASPCPSPSQDLVPDMATLYSKASCGSTTYQSESSSDFSPVNSFQSTANRKGSEGGKAYVPPAVKPVAAWVKNDVPPPPPCAPVLRHVLGLPDDCPSVGSLKHPYGCADFCKYAKKPKGCKDGDACIRCHICTNKKPRQPWQIVRRSAYCSYGTRTSGF
mmetsp:Transcript_3393/g.7562  ORF Transcript_3393/g.7562 Transcript_3393/m.7562 type:complete len:290 (-) Transcript_3393:1012-1881(-)